MTTTLSWRLRELAATRAEELLTEVPATLRRLRLLLVVLSVSVPVFLAGLLAIVAWRLLT